MQEGPFSVTTFKLYRQFATVSVAYALETTQLTFCHPTSNQASFNFDKTGVHVDQFPPFMVP